MALMHVNYFSDVLGMSMNMDVILPQQTIGQIGMEGKVIQGKYPTLYLLHGMSDDHTIWQRRTSIERYVSDMGIAVVMPTVHLGWYTDMYHGLKYWTFISQELPQICRNFFPNMSEKKEDTFVVGLSMGGYGALKLALGTSDIFGAAASLSGALNVENMSKLQVGGKKKEYWVDVFGPLENIRETKNDLRQLAIERKETKKKLPKLYLWCGKQDELYQDNIEAREYLNELGYDCTFEEADGDHQWKYWDQQIQRVLEWLPIRTKETNQ